MMALSKDFFNTGCDPPGKGVVHKNRLIKKDIVACLAVKGRSTLADLANELHISVPTATKLVGELINEQVLEDTGKVETAGGRRPVMYGLAASAGFFVGMELSGGALRLVMTDIHNKVLNAYCRSPFELEDSPECMDAIIGGISAFVKNCGVDRRRVSGIGICVSGLVNPQSGQSSFSFSSGDKSFGDTVEERVGMKVLVESETRARCYAEYVSFGGDPVGDMLYVHIDRSVSVGMVFDRELYYGKSGFAGEFGHTPFFNNEKLCTCGKKGCLETEISGKAIEEQAVNEIRNGVGTTLREKYDAGESIRMEDVINAAERNDILSIDLIERAGEKAGKSIAFLVNLLNPEIVVIGGSLAAAGDYLMLPLQSAANKYSLNLIYRDTRFRLPAAGEYSGCRGAAMLVRNKVIGLR